MSPALRTLIFTAIVPVPVAVIVPVALRSIGWRMPFALEGIGFVLVLSGVLIYVWCAAEFAWARGTPSPTDPPRELVTRGLYRYSRNPMYVGVLLVVLGQAWLYRSFAVLTYALVLAIGFHLRVILYEEPRLLEQFGQAFEAYRSRVPRWLGWRTPA